MPSVALGVFCLVAPYVSIQGLGKTDKQINQKDSLFVL